MYGKKYEKKTNKKEAKICMEKKKEAKICMEKKEGT